jgi:hypothetical protein
VSRVAFYVTFFGIDVDRSPRKLLLLLLLLLLNVGEKRSPTEY